MASAIDVRRSVPGIAAMLATAVLVLFGTGLNPFSPCMWLAPVPVLLFALGASWWTAALVAGGAMLLGLLNLWGLLHGALRLPLGALLPLYVTEGVMFALVMPPFRRTARRGWHGTALLGFPAFWVAFEWSMNLTGPHGTGGSLAYSQLRFLPVLQLASITGPWGITFLLCALAASVRHRDLAAHARSTARATASSAPPRRSLPPSSCGAPVRLAAPTPGSAGAGRARGVRWSQHRRG